MATEQAVHDVGLAPAALRKRFKAACEATDNRFQNFQIRTHRSLSWWTRALETDLEKEPDARLLFGWIAFNALYGRWDQDAGFAAKDREAWQKFLSELIAFDADQLIGQQLVTLKPEVLAILENKFLDPRFWQNPHEPGNTRGSYRKAPSLYFERRWTDIAIMAIDRVYVLRGQIVHGAATRGSRLNRTALRHCCQVLEGLLGPILRLVIEHRADDRWPPLCYPPIDETVSSKPPIRSKRLAR